MDDPTAPEPQAEDLEDLVKLLPTIPVEEAGVEASGDAA